MLVAIKLPKVKFVVQMSSYCAYILVYYIFCFRASMWPELHYSYACDY